MTLWSWWTWVLNATQIKRCYAQRLPGLAWRSSKRFIVATVAIGLFADTFLYCLVVPVLPYLLEDKIGLPQDRVQGTVSSILAAFAGASVVSAPFIGFLTDQVSARQIPYLTGLLAMLGATTMLSLGTSVPALLVARILQGISAAVVWTVGLVICLDAVGGENLGATIGPVFSFVSMGGVTGPVAGGILYETVGLDGVCGLSYAILAVDLVMRLLVIEEKVAQRYRGEISDACSATADIENSNPSQPPIDGGNEETPLLGAHATVTNDVDFKIPTEQLSPICQRISILPCLANARLVAALFASMIQAIVMSSFDATVPTVAQEYYGFSSLQAGLLFAPLSVTNLVCGVVFGRMTDRYGARLVGTASYAFFVCVFVSITQIKPGPANAPWYAATLVLAGIGHGGIGSPAVVEAGIVVEKYFHANRSFFGVQGPYAQLYGLNCMAYNLGMALGPEMAGQIKQRFGYSATNAALAGTCAVTALLCWTFMGDRPSPMTSASSSGVED